MEISGIPVVTPLVISGVPVAPTDFSGEPVVPPVKKFQIFR
jgi:hypothetical protein